MQNLALITLDYTSLNFKNLDQEKKISGLNTKDNLETLKKLDVRLG